MLGLLPTDAVGTATLASAAPAVLPSRRSGAQAWTLDATAPQGFTATDTPWIAEP